MRHTPTPCRHLLPVLLAALTGASFPSLASGPLPRLSTSCPHAILTQDFEGTRTNMSLRLPGWRNVAAEGGRSWWGYELYDEAGGNHAAKITAYGLPGGGGDAVDCLLVTPPLSLSKAPARKFHFRFRGTDMKPEMASSFEVCYIDMHQGHTRIIPLPVSIDFSQEADDTWQNVVIDFSQADTSGNLSDVFFIGFRLTDVADEDYSGVYYIDDVSWGRDVFPDVCPTADVARLSLPGPGGDLCYVMMR